MSGKCWSTWETSQSVRSAVLHRCDLALGHVGLHQTEGMQWGHGVSLLTPQPIRASDPLPLSRDQAVRAQHKIDGTTPPPMPRPYVGATGTVFGHPCVVVADPIRESVDPG